MNGTAITRPNGSGTAALAPPESRTEEAGTALALSRPSLTDDKVQLLKDTICKGATDNELALFIAQCNRTGLDPFVRQIHAVFRYDAAKKRQSMTVQVGIDGLRLIADRTGDYAPGPEADYAYALTGELVSATAHVKKWAHGDWHVVSESARWDEYVQVGREGRPMSLWASKPHVMLGKVAEARALRRAFPQETSGLYAPEEMAAERGAAPLDPEAEELRELRERVADLAGVLSPEQLETFKADVKGMGGFKNLSAAQLAGLESRIVGVMEDNYAQAEEAKLADKPDEAPPAEAAHAAPPPEAQIEDDGDDPFADESHN